VALIGDIKTGTVALATTRARFPAGTSGAQFLLDFIEAENSIGFHAGQETVQVLALSLDEIHRVSMMNEQPLDRWIEGPDNPVPVDDDDGVDRRFKDRPQNGSIWSES
jgi:hypothetical protein